MDDGVKFMLWCIVILGIILIILVIWALVLLMRRKQTNLTIIEDEQRVPTIEKWRELGEMLSTTPIESIIPCSDISLLTASQINNQYVERGRESRYIEDKQNVNYISSDTTSITNCDNKQQHGLIELVSSSPISEEETRTSRNIRQYNTVDPKNMKIHYQRQNDYSSTRSKNVDDNNYNGWDEGVSRRSTNRKNRYSYSEDGSERDYVGQEQQINEDNSRIRNYTIDDEFFYKGGQTSEDECSIRYPSSRINTQNKINNVQSKITTQSKINEQSKVNEIKTDNKKYKCEKELSNKKQEKYYEKGKDYENSNIIDVCEYSQFCVRLHKKGDSVIITNIEGDDAHEQITKTNNVLLIRIVSSLGFLFGIGSDRRLYILTNFTDEQWNWKYCDFIPMKEITHISSTGNNKCLWLQNNRGHGVLYNMNSNKRIVALTKVDNMRDKRRIYGETSSMYLEITNDNTLYCADKIIKGIKSAILDHTGKITLLKIGNEAREIRLINYSPRYLI